MSSEDRYEVLVDEGGEHKELSAKELKWLSADALRRPSADGMKVLSADGLKCLICDVKRGIYMDDMIADDNLKVESLLKELKTASLFRYIS